MRSLAALVIALCLVISGCSWDSRLAGGGTDTETGGGKVSGRVVTAEGIGMACSTITLRPKAFLEILGESKAGGLESQTTSAGPDGFYSFDSVPPGVYRIFARCGDLSMAQGEVRVIAGGPRVDVTPMEAKGPGTLAGRVLLDSLDLAPVIQIFGLSRVEKGDSLTGRFAMADLPEGVYDVRISGIDPFREPQVIRGIRISTDSTTLLADVRLLPVEKQPFRVTDGFLALDGIGSGNAFIVDNDRFDNTADDELLWVLASLGRAKVLANILPGRAGVGPDSLRSLYRASLRDIEVARLGGLRNIPDASFGASRPLALPPSGRWQDMVPEENPGSRLMVEAARKATPGNPLVVFAGGPLTTVATAYLMEPALADRIVILGTYYRQRPDLDSLALFVVQNKCRFAGWGDGYSWDPPGIGTAPVGLPANRMTTHVLEKFGRAASGFAFYGDLSFVAHAFGGKGMRSARGGRLSATGGPPVFGSAGVPDFVDIALEANDFAWMQAYFSSVLSDSAAYHPWDVPGRIEAESHSGSSGVRLDSAGESGERIAGMKTGEWADFRIRADAAAEFTLEIRCAGDSAGRLSATPETGSPVAVDLSQAVGWRTVTCRMPVEGGTRILRLRAEAGAWDIDWIRLTR